MKYILRSTLVIRALSILIALAAAHILNFNTPESFLIMFLVFYTATSLALHDYIIVDKCILPNTDEEENSNIDLLDWLIDVSKSTFISCLAFNFGAVPFFFAVFVLTKTFTNNLYFKLTVAYPLAFIGIFIGLTVFSFGLRHLVNLIQSICKYEEVDSRGYYVLVFKVSRFLNGNFFNNASKILFMATFIMLSYCTLFYKSYVALIALFILLVLVNCWMSYRSDLNDTSEECDVGCECDECINEMDEEDLEDSLDFIRSKDLYAEFRAYQDLREEERQNRNSW